MKYPAKCPVKYCLYIKAANSDICKFRNNSGKKGSWKNNLFTCLFCKHLLHFLCISNAVKNDQICFRILNFFCCFFKSIPFTIW